MKKFLHLTALLSGLSACGQPPSVEEKLLMQSFSTLQAAFVYDEVCNHVLAKDRYDFEGANKAKNINLFDNERMLAARLGGLYHIRYPDHPVKKGVEWLTNIQSSIQKQAREKFQKDGCETEGAKSVGRALATYSSLPSIIILPKLDQEIEKQGGKVTSVEEVEAAGKSTK